MPLESKLAPKDWRQGRTKVREIRKRKESKKKPASEKKPGRKNKGDQTGLLRVFRLGGVGERCSN